MPRAEQSHVLLIVDSSDSVQFDENANGRIPHRQEGKGIEGMEKYLERVRKGMIETSERGGRVGLG